MAKRKKRQRPYSRGGHTRAIVAGGLAGHLGGAVTGGMVAGNVSVARGKGMAGAEKAIPKGMRVGRNAGAVAGAVAGHRSYVKRHSNPDGSKHIVKGSKRSRRTPAQRKTRHRRQRRAGYVAAGGLSAAAAVTGARASNARKVTVAGRSQHLGGVGANRVPRHKAGFSRPNRKRRAGSAVKTSAGPGMKGIGTGRRGRQRRDRRGRFA